MALLLAAPVSPEDEPRRPAAGPPPKVSYRHHLATTTGVLPLHGARLTADPAGHELLVVADGVIRVFNRAGMETYAFGDDAETGRIFSVAPIPDGGYAGLVADEGRLGLKLLDFRGEFVSSVEVSGLPQDLSESFRPGAVDAAGDHLYLSDLANMLVVVLERDGRYVKHHDLASLLGVAGKRSDVGGVRSLRVTPKGEILFTVPSLFKAYSLSPDGQVRGFGQRGNGPGKFNVVAGIARDDEGRYYVSDMLKCAVLVFDAEMRFLVEFGYRGVRPENMVAPVDVVALDGLVYVSQYAQRGVNVFEVKTRSLE